MAQLVKVLEVKGHELEVEDPPTWLKDRTFSVVH